MVRGCGFCHPPPEDSEDREVMDRFAEFLDRAGPPGDTNMDEIRAMIWGDDFAAWRRFIFGTPDIHGPAF
jgi:hypothetical protein